MFKRGISFGIMVLLMSSAGIISMASAQENQSDSSQSDPNAYAIGYQSTTSDQSSNARAIYLPGTSYESEPGYGTGAYYWPDGSRSHGSCPDCQQCCRNFVPWYMRSPGVPAMFDIWASRERLYGNQFLNLMSARWQAQMARDRLWENWYANPYSTKLEIQGVKDRLGAMRQENDMYRQYVSYNHYNPGFDQAFDGAQTHVWSGLQSYSSRHGGDPYPYGEPDQEYANHPWDEGPVGYDEAYQP